MLIKYLSILSAAFFIGKAFIVIFRKISSKYKFLINKDGIPLIGGLCFGASFIITCLAAFLFISGLRMKVMGILIAGLIMLIFGAIDDHRELSIGAKFFVQIMVTCMLVVFGIRTQIVYIGNLGNIIITFIWVLGITNAFNHLDIMDGLAGLPAVVISLTFFLIAVFNNDIVVAILSLALAGATLIFLTYNFPPANIYMGNSGSHFLGFILAAIALAVSYAPMDRKIALLSPVLVLGLPIFDTAFLIFMRKRDKKSIFKKSGDHFVLQFLRAGYSIKTALFHMTLLCVFFCGCGMGVSRFSNILSLVIIIIAVSVSLALAIRMAKDVKSVQ